MDDLDRAEERSSQDLALALTVRKPEGPQATGSCLYCEEPTTLRWCSAECRDQWTEETNRRNMK